MADENNKTSSKPRGAAGKFIPKDKAENITSEDIPDLVHKSTKMSGALKDLQEFEEVKEFDKPLVSVSVNNPIAWLLKWINDLRKKQTTTISFKLGVPLIALPVFVFALASVFFGLGRITSPARVGPDTMSRAGVLRVFTQEGVASYYLILNDGEALELLIPSNIDFKALDGKRVLASGKYDRDTNKLSVNNVNDLEVLPTTISPISTITILPETPTPDPTKIPETSPEATETIDNDTSI